MFYIALCDLYKEHFSEIAGEEISNVENYAFQVYKNIVTRNPLCFTTDLLFTFCSIL